MCPNPWFVTRKEFGQTIERIEREMERMADDTQTQVDQLTAQIGTVATDLDAAKQKIQAEIDSLAGQVGPNVDLSALQAEVDALDPAVQALGNLAPTPPAQP